MPAPRLLRVPSTKARRWLSLPVVLFIAFMTIGSGAAFAKQLPPKASDNAVDATAEPAPEETSEPAPAETTSEEATTEEATTEEEGTTEEATTEEASATSKQVVAQQQGGSNRGTIKIDGTPINAFPPSNEPHQECSFVVQFFGFRAGVPASVTLRVHPPTGSGQVIFQGSTTLQNDGPGGGTDFDGAIAIPNLATALSAFPEHPQQGFHVKVTAFGGNVRKQKVFWMDCPPGPGSITIRKNAEPNSSASFLFRGFFGPFSLVDNGTGGHRRTFGGLSAGVYAIREAEIPAGWRFAGASCDSPAASVAGALVTINLGAGEHVTCTFVNRLIPPPAVPRGPVLAVTGLSVVPLMALGLSFLISGAVMERAGRRRRGLDPAIDELEEGVAVTERAALPEWDEGEAEAAEARRRKVQTAVVVGGAVVVAAALVAWRMRKRS